VDVAFAAALRRSETHPPVLSAEAQKIDARLTGLQKQLDADKASVARLTADVAKAPDSQRGALQDQLNLAQSQLELDQDEVDDENQNLAAAGGNAHQRIEAMLKQHAAMDDKLPSLPAGKAVLANLHGLARRLRHYFELRDRAGALEQAQARVAGSLAPLGVDRQALAAQLAAGKSGVAQHADAAGLLDATRRIAGDQRVLTLLDQRVAIRKDIVDGYGKWQDVLGTRMARTLHAALIDIAVVVGILIGLLFLDRWLESLFGRTKLARRQIGTLRTVTRVALQLAAIVVIALVLVGVPGQIGTFLGIVGAGLTVALKDFIVGFIGWLVLMGKNGMRLGDWVEINGVGGEVVDLGMFHTVLLETGNWTQAGHPTGRRVTFANSFAIQGHYFNFSTSGQWVWDEVLVLVPYERDPHVVADAILKEVLEATGNTAREAEREWQRAARSHREVTFSAAPGIMTRPAVGGVEVAVRYVTRAGERFKVRTRLYQAAVQMLSAHSAAASTPPERLQMTTQT
jgi:small-conductance mechanosensitive channel